MQNSYEDDTFQLPEEEQPGKRRMELLALVAVGGIALLGTAGVWFYTSSNSTSAIPTAQVAEADGDCVKRLAEAGFGEYAQDAATNAGPSCDATTGCVGLLTQKVGATRAQGFAKALIGKPESTVARACAKAIPIFSK